MTKPIKHSISLIIALLFFASAQTVVAATIYILPAQKNLSLDEEFNIDIKVNSEGESINATQATINWPADILQFVEVEKTGSVFNFWVDEPSLSSTEESISFIGGTSKGITGAALQILRIKFKTLSAGTAAVTITDTAITASDGQGTNVLSKISGASYAVGVETVQPAPPAPSPTTAPTPAPQPVVVTRPAVSAKNLPQAPVIQAPLYPDPTRWSNILGELTVLWEIPEDITAVAVTLDNSPNTIPAKAEPKLTTGKNLGILTEGEWYIHAQFKNNIGWGPTAHYRVALDTKPPLAFEVTLPEGETTDNPSPVLQFRTSDELSGLKRYQIKIDDNEVIQVPAAEFPGSFTLPLQKPGSHRLTVAAIDQAENSVEDSLTIEILPILAPTFTFVTQELFSDEQKGLTVKGTSLPNINVLLQVAQLFKNGLGTILTEQTVATDDQGNWEFTFNEPLRSGEYVATAQSQDVRGALSAVIQSEKIRVKTKPIIQLGPLQLGKGGAALLLLLLLIIGFGSGILFYKKRQGKISSRVIFAESEISKIFKLLMEDANKISESLKTPTTADDSYAIERLKNNIKKMELYLKKGINKIKR